MGNNYIEKAKNYFSSLKVSNLKTNFNRMNADPYLSAKTNYKFTKYLVFMLMAFIAFTFIKLIWNVSGGSSAMTLMLRIAFLIVGVIILSKIYFLVLNPLKKTVDHYESSPTTMTSHYVDVNKEVDEIFDNFEKKEKIKEVKKK